MPQGDAISKVPTVEEEMASFKGYATENGETKSVVTDTSEEREALTKKAEIDAQAAAAAAASDKKTAEADEATGEKPAEEADKGQKAVAAKKLEDYKDDETITAAEARKLLASAVSGRLGEERRRTRAGLTQRDTELAELRDRLSRLEGGAPRDGKQPVVEGDGPPDPSKFEYGELDTRFIKAQTRYEVQQELKSQREKDSVAQRRDADARQAREITQRRDAMAEKGVEKYSDFMEVVIDNTWSADNPDGWPLSPTLGELILTSDVGPDIAYELASNPKEARRVFGLPSSQQAAYFGRLEARFTSATSSAAAGKKAEESGAKPVKVTQVPPPPDTRAKGKSATQPAADTNDFKAFERIAGF